MTDKDNDGPDCTRAEDLMRAVYELATATRWNDAPQIERMMFRAGFNAAKAIYTPKADAMLKERAK